MNNLKIKNDIHKKDKKIFLKIFALIIATLIAYKMIIGESNIFTGILGFIDVIKPALIAILVAYLLYIPANKIEKALEKTEIQFFKKKARGISIGVVYLALALLIYFLMKYGIPFIYNNIQELVKNIPHMVNGGVEYFKNLPKEHILYNLRIDQEIEKLSRMDYVNEVLSKIRMEDVLAQARKALDIASEMFNIFVTIIVSIYMLYYRNNIKAFTEKAITAIFSKNASKTFSYYVEKTNYIFFRFITTQILDGLIVGTIITIVLLIFKVKYAVALGMLIGLFNLIPFFGAIIAVGIAATVTFFTGGINQAILILIVSGVIQQIDANILNPILLGQSLDVNKILIIISVTVGGVYFGPLGMFLAVPFISVASLIVNDVLEEKLRKKRIELLLNKKRKLKLLKNKTEVKVENKIIETKKQ